jgi:anthranilate synthase component 1
MHYIQYPDRLDFLAFHQLDATVFPCLLQSAHQSGWDILFALPQETQLFYSGEEARFFATLNQIPVQNNLAGTTKNSTQHFPFCGGWFVYAGYELLHAIEPTVTPRAISPDVPLAALLRIPAAALYHRNTQTTWLVAESQSQLQEMQQLFHPCSAAFNPLHVLSLAEEPADIFLQGVARCKEYITAGDVFQVNLSRAWDAVLAPHNTAVDVYHQLQLANPAPFSACVDLGKMQIISSSPERLVRVKEGWIESRPIAGTYPRAETAAEDATSKAQMMASMKERAEHIMLIDLKRNDLGRICQPGTVEVNELMSLASYAHVHHIESNIRGRLQAGLTMQDILRALFPGGTITGCPKVRTMQIIRELEMRPRLAYTGSVGYINHEGTLDLNILIRSFIKQESQLYFRAGAGIVADSIPEKELQETRAKAKGLLRALGKERRWSL